MSLDKKEPHQEDILMGNTRGGANEVPSPGAEQALTGGIMEHPTVCGKRVLAGDEGADSIDDSLQASGGSTASYLGGIGLLGQPSPAREMKVGSAEERDGKSSDRRDRPPTRCGSKESSKDIRSDGKLKRDEPLPSSSGEVCEEHVVRAKLRLKEKFWSVKQGKGKGKDKGKGTGTNKNKILRMRHERCPPSELAKRTQLLQAMVYWTFNDFIVPLVRRSVEGNFAGVADVPRYGPEVVTHEVDLYQSSVV